VGDDQFGDIKGAAVDAPSTAERDSEKVEVVNQGKIDLKANDEEISSASDGVGGDEM
jgi:hypothetical protein